MDPIEVVDLCRTAAIKGAPKDIFVPRMFASAEYLMMWDKDPNKVKRMLNELLCGENVGDGLELLYRFGVLDALFPEITSMKNLGDANGRHKDVWEHTKSVVAGVPNTVELRWGALLHDIGKARTRRFQNGRVTFHNHDLVGARMVDNMQERTKLFSDDVELLRTVRMLVLQHLRPASYKASWSDNAVKRFINECGSTAFFEKLMALSQADLTTKIPAKRDRALANRDALKIRVEKALEEINAPKLPKGTMGEIMKKVAAKPGPWLQDLRDHLESMMKVGVLLAGQPVEYYVKAGLEVVESASDQR